MACQTAGNSTISLAAYPDNKVNFKAPNYYSFWELNQTLDQWIIPTKGSYVENVSPEVSYI